MTRAQRGARVPLATYRLQLRSGFGFEDARRLVPYLHVLGVSHVYASPLLAARSGSTHGYDVTDPTRLDPELGDEAAFESLVAELDRHGMGIVLDIVPNHMAASPENPWWTDLLAHGRGSAYAGFFDVDWEAPGHRGEVLLPILEDDYARVLERGEISLALEGDRLTVRYSEWRLPVDPRSYPILLAHALGLRATLPYRRLEPEEERRRFAARYRRDAAFRDAVDATLGEITKATPAGLETLDALLDAQSYRLASWRLARREINYRRFLDIADLACLRVEDQAVFETSHALVLRLAGAGKVQGLRVDHVDGLKDPLGYLRRLATRFPGGYLLVEKILAPGESLSSQWPVKGTTGYEFGALAVGVFVDEPGARVVEQSTGAPPFPEVARAGKRQVMEDLFAGEAQSLGRRLHRIARLDPPGRDLTLDDLRAAIVEVTVGLSTYRTYIRGRPVAPADRRRIEEAVRTAREAVGGGSLALDFLEGVLLLRSPPGAGAEALEFVMRWQQFTGSVAAKGVEDTALYRHVGLLARNEVGDDPSARCGPERFHAGMAERRRRWPDALSATSTHDSKRSEDVRARIAVLSEMPDAWAQAVARWSHLNRRHRARLGGRPVPDAAEEAYVYQTLLGAWPLDPAGEGGLADRLEEHVTKALREAKVHSSWVRPDERYEEAAARFLRAVLAHHPFLRDFLAFLEPVAFWGALNALSQVVLKAAAPGVPDFYQGTELWSLTLVDPDNRSPVDFERRVHLLEEIRDADPAGLVASWQDGRVKMLVTKRALRLRRKQGLLFATGSYLPVEAAGRLARHAFAFARRRRRAWVVAVVPRLVSRIAPRGELPLGRVWDRTSLRLPVGAPTSWRNGLTGEEVRARDGRLLVRDVLATFPVALLANLE